MMASANELSRPAKVSFVGGIFIVFVKFIAYWLTGSTALKSDAVEGIVNVLASSFALWAIRFSELPADADHPYGHGKIEHFSAGLEGGLVSLAALFILYEGMQALFLGSHLAQLDWGLALNLVAGAMNGLLGVYLIRAGKRYRSSALEADGHHVLSDFYTTLGVAAGLLLVRITGAVWLDAVIALLVGVWLAWTGYRLIKGSIRALLDEEDPALLERLFAAMGQLRGDDVIALHALRTLRSGRWIHVDVHVVVPEFLSVAEAHDRVEEFSEQVLRSAGLEGEVHAHIDPCHRAYCRGCAIAACPIRQEPLQEQLVWSMEMAVSPVPPTDLLPHRG